VESRNMFKINSKGKQQKKFSRKINLLFSNKCTIRNKNSDWHKTVEEFRKMATDQDMVHLVDPVGDGI
jgi:hypothetical protein